MYIFLQLTFIEDLAYDDSKVAKHKRSILNKEDEALKLNLIPACVENFENEF